MDTQTLILGATIAQLRTQHSMSADDATGHILDGISLAKRLVNAYVISQGAEPLMEDAVAELEIIAATSSYQTLASWTVASGRIGILSKVEMAAENYTNARFRLNINGKEKWTDKRLPDSLTLSFPELTIAGGHSVTIEGKSTSGSFDMWGDITGKEVSI